SCPDPRATAFRLEGRRWGTNVYHLNSVVREGEAQWVVSAFRQAADLRPLEPCRPGSQVWRGEYKSFVITLIQRFEECAQVQFAFWSRKVFNELPAALTPCFDQPKPD